MKQCIQTKDKVILKGIFAYQILMVVIGHIYFFITGVYNQPDFISLGTLLFLFFTISQLVSSSYLLMQDHRAKDYRKVLIFNTYIEFSKVFFVSIGSFSYKYFWGPQLQLFFISNGEKFKLDVKNDLFLYFYQILFDNDTIFTLIGISIIPLIIIGIQFFYLKRRNWECQTN